ncbi:DUF4124 domain-containing protein [Nitrosococcus watsonii]|nr:DUF4124 domain-containing protein [Nitrosococcus watsonii]
MPIFLLLTFIAMLFMSLAVPIAADSAYKWVDEKGVTHYSQRPPPDRETKKMASPPAPDKLKMPAESLNMRLERLEQEQAARERAAKQQAQEEKQQAARKHNCEAARKNLTLYKGNPRLRIGDSSGNYTRLNEKERHAHITEAKQQIEENCD